MARIWQGLMGIWWLMATAGWAANEAQVRVKSLQDLLFYPEQDAPAEVVSLRHSRIASQVSATLREIRADVGDQVAAGAVLAVQDCWDREQEASRAEAEVAALQAEITLASRQRERASSLQKQGQAPRETLDRRESELLSLEARQRSARIGLATARSWLARCTIQAPFAGVVMSREAHLGNWATAGSPLFELLDVENVELRSDVDPTLLAHPDHMKGPEFVHSLGHHPVQPRVWLPSHDPVTRTRQVRLVFTRDKPLAGTAGRLHWQDPRLHVPAWLLVRRQEGLGIFLVDQGVARFQVLAQAQEGRPVPWTGSREGVVVVDGREGLQHGQAVVGLNNDRP